MIKGRSVVILIHFDDTDDRFVELTDYCNNSYGGNERRSHGIMVENQKKLTHKLSIKELFAG